VGHEGGLEAAVGEFRDRLGVAVEPAVVLDFAVLDGGVQVEADEDALAVVEVVERLERGHSGCSNGRASARKNRLIGVRRRLDPGPSIARRADRHHRRDPSPSCGYRG